MRPKMQFAQFALLFLAVCVAGAIDAEFHGFIHFTNWVAHFSLNRTAEEHCNAHEQGYCFRYPDGSTLSLAVAKDICSADPNCIAMGEGGPKCAQVHVIALSPTPTGTRQH